VTLDDSTVLSTRLYDRPTGRLGAFAGEGSVVLTEFSVFSPSPAAGDAASVDAELVTTAR
jgi:beta-fructofuranosidase